MKRMISSAAVALAMLALPAGLLAQENKIISGDDNRLDYFQAPAARKALADSVVSLWQESDVKASGSRFKLTTVKFTDQIKAAAGVPLCAGEPFREQPVGAFCSGSLIGEDLVMTAGHCIPNEDRCADTRFVFGFAVKARGGAAVTEVGANDVYSCKKVEVTKWQSSVRPELTPRQATALRVLLDRDYAVVRLDRKVTGRRPLAVNGAGDLKTGSPLFVIGHPVGLPLKVADDASVMNIKEGELYFLANLDTYAGNSGSAVFNARTNKVEGILVRGDRDFRPGEDGFWLWKKDCVESNRVPQTQGNEAVSKINDAILSLINPPAPKAEVAPAVPVDDARSEEIIERFNVHFQ
ncbi:MAG: V8-like Glu-specific endopeptidase [Elusimicrobia bacterium]|nr:MAG: V8-like Glu-specific endopeptidase [Elusimicrobiota bacterium]KAF0156754.1 MAG: V8-like Glu-specific endopeptidase [Elusimicrobiota bacterium]